MDDPRAPGPDHHDYEPPDVKDLPANDGPAVTAAGKTPPPDGGGPGPEWRPTASKDTP
jgi:hypothetical protein